MRTVVMVMLGILFSVGAMADGMSFKTIGAEMEVKATEQRAVMWLRDGVWEIHIQPIFERDAGRSAWVVPFPVRPEIHPGSLDFFDQLELLTSPAFIRICADDVGGGFGCLFMGTEAGTKGGDAVGISGSGYVKVWERGTVGELDFAVISSTQGESLIAWLLAEGFEVNQAARDALLDYETREEFFFAARLSAETDPDKPINPVRFVLPEMDPPAYPLRLTRLGVSAGDFLELTLWVVSPIGNYYPDSHAYETIEQDLGGRALYDAYLDDIYARYLPEAALALLYHMPLHADSRLLHKACGYDSCVRFEEMSIEAPDNWCGEIEEIERSQAWVSRLQGRLSPYSMREDLSLRQGVDYLYWIKNVHEIWTTCDGRLATTGCLVLLALGLLIRRRS